MAATDSPPTVEEHRVSVILDAELRERLEAAAKAEDRSLGGVVRQALREYFESRQDVGR